MVSHHKFKEIMLERYWELQVVRNFLWRNPGSNIKVSFMLCYRHCIFSLKMISSEMLFLGYCVVHLNFNKLTKNIFLTLICLGGGGQLNRPCGFLKNVSSIEIVEPWLFVTFNIILKHIFPEYFIEFPQVVQIKEV